MISIQISKTSDFAESDSVSKNRKIFIENAMRKLIEKQLKIGQVEICDIPVDLHCRDEIPRILFGIHGACRQAD